MTNSSIEKKLKSYVNVYKDVGKYSTYLFDNEEMFVKKTTLQIYYSSIIISLYSFLEQSMLQLCKISENNQSIKINDISGKGIFQFKKYLEKVVRIDFNPINDEWNEITKYNQLRNLFVHSSNSILDFSESKRKINSIKEIRGIDTPESADCFLIEFKNDEAIRNFIKTIKEFLKKIYYEDYT